MARQRARAQKRNRVCRDSQPGHWVQADDLPPEIFEPADIGGALRDDPLNDEKVRLVDALGRSRGNRARAARLLGISRATLYRRLSDLKINPEEK
jgi:transcriptional regulator of acetoin/glycerol metabolism